MQAAIAIPCFNDNYIWLLQSAHGCWVVDPGDAAPVIQWLTEQEQALAGILLTHHHADHVGGVVALQHYALTQRRECPVWGPDECSRWRTHAAMPEATLNLPGLGVVDILDVSAHTRGHVAYYLADLAWLLCGDSLFSAGCGRLFEGDAADLERALQRINSLPAETLIFPTHEYTLANLRFAHAVEPTNADIAHAIQEVSTWREEGLASLPTTLARERKINPFLRLSSAELRHSVSTWSAQSLATELETLRQLRYWKDQY